MNLLAKWYPSLNEYVCNSHIAQLGWVIILVNFFTEADFTLLIIYANGGDAAAKRQAHFQQILKKLFLWQQRNLLYDEGKEKWDYISILTFLFLKKAHLTGDDGALSLNMVCT